jgi:hypothetical protein
MQFRLQQDLLEQASCSATYPVWGVERGQTSSMQPLLFPRRLEEHGLRDSDFDRGMLAASASRSVLI